jgi:hypothetical protein
VTLFIAGLTVTRVRCINAAAWHASVWLSALQREAGMPPAALTRTRCFAATQAATHLTLIWTPSPAAHPQVALKLICKYASNADAKLTTAAADGDNGPTPLLALGAFASGGLSPWTTAATGRAAAPLGVCDFTPGSWSSKYLGGRCAMPCVQYLGFDEVYWRNASGGFCPCHSQASAGTRGRAPFRPGAAPGPAAAGGQCGGLLLPAGSSGLAGLMCRVLSAPAAQPPPLPPTQR